MFETSGVGQAPSKDFFSLIVMPESVIWRTWKITLRSNKSLPSETIQLKHVFTADSSGTRLQGEIRRVFGEETLNYVLSLVTQSWLPYLKSDILIEILVQLDLLDIARLAQVCRALHNVCSCDALWRKLYVKQFVIISPEIYSIAEDVGWKRAFLVNRLKLQAVKVSTKLHIKQHGENSNKTAKEERKKLTLVI
ncbi:hypothetical protein ACROYT_G001723 [Oculina patagonica]